MPTRTNSDYFFYYLNWFAIVMNWFLPIRHTLQGVFSWWDVGSLLIMTALVLINGPLVARPFTPSKYEKRFWDWWLLKVLENLLLFGLMALSSVILVNMWAYFGACIILTILVHLIFENYVY